MSMIAFMTFGEYIGTLFGTGLFGKNKAKFGQDLFRAAGSESIPSEESIKAWCIERRHCRTKDFFPDGSLNEIKFIDYLSQKAQAHGLWKELQKAFLSLRPADSTAWGCCVDLETQDSDVFFWSLLNQFQKILQLPESKLCGNNLTVTAPLQAEISPGQMRNVFLEAINQYKIMYIINRKPPILNRDDSVRLNLFLDIMDALGLTYIPQNNLLCASIKSFIDALQFQTLSLEATLNNRFDFEDETASINMEDDEDEIELINTEDDEDEIELINMEDDELGVTELTVGLIADAYNPTHLLKISVGEMDWGNFRHKMNLLYKDIVSWQEKTQKQ